MKTLLAICVVAVAALANVGCLSETGPQTSQSEAVSAETQWCPDVEEAGDGTVVFCSYDAPGWCCCDHVDMVTAEIFGQTCANG
jgi:hypothetical protein